MFINYISAKSSTFTIYAGLKIFPVARCYGCYGAACPPTKTFRCVRAAQCATLLQYFRHIECIISQQTFPRSYLLGPTHRLQLSMRKSTFSSFAKCLVSVALDLNVCYFIQTWRAFTLSYSSALKRSFSLSSVSTTQRRLCAPARVFLNRYYVCELLFYAGFLRKADLLTGY